MFLFLLFTAIMQCTKYIYVNFFFNLSTHWHWCVLCWIPSLWLCAYSGAFSGMCIACLCSAQGISCCIRELAVHSSLSHCFRVCMTCDETGQISLISDLKINTLFIIFSINKIRILPHLCNQSCSG